MSRPNCIQDDKEWREYPHKTNDDTPNKKVILITSGSAVPTTENMLPDMWMREKLKKRRSFVSSTRHLCHINYTPVYELQRRLAAIYQVFHVPSIVHPDHKSTVLLNHSFPHLALSPMFHWDSLQSTLGHTVRVQIIKVFCLSFFIHQTNQTTNAYQ